EAPPPAAVIFAESTQDVADAVKLASQYEVPVIPFAVGSSLEGHLLAVQGGISIDVNRMNRVLSVNAEDLTVTVQPGVTRKQLNEEVKSTGLFFPLDPGAAASMAAVSQQTGPRRLATLLAIWKAGGGYLPLDPALPTDRLAFMIADANVQVVVTDEPSAASLPKTAATVINLDTEPIDQTEDRPARSRARPANIAYVI